MARIESSSTSGSGFTEIGTVALVAATYIYTYYDQTAATGLYYRSRYSNSGNTNRSDYSAEFQAASAPITYCSFYDVKQRLGIPLTDTTDDEELLQYCGQVTAMIDSLTHRTFVPVTFTATTFDGYDAIEGGRCFLIPRGIRTISLLEVASYTGGSFSTIASGDFFIRPTASERDANWPGTEIWISDVPSSSTTLPYFPPGYANVRITGTGGWASTPEDIQTVALNAAVSTWRARGAGSGDNFETGMDGVRRFSRLLSIDDKQTLMRYQIKLPVLI